MDSIAAVGSEVSRGTPTLYVIAVSPREDQTTTSIVLFFWFVLLCAKFGIVNLLARLLPSLDSVAHDAHVAVTRCFRPPGGFMRRASMQVGAVEYELRAFVGGQLAGDVVLVVAGEKMRSRNHAGARAQAPSVRIVDVNVRVRVGHQ